MSIRLLLADDHLMFRETLCLILSQQGDIELLGQAGSGAELLALLQQHTPDVAIIDIGLPDMTGIELARQVRRDYPQVGIVALSGYTDRLFVEEMLKAGARAYVAKAGGIEDLVQAIRAVAAGKAFLSPDIAAVLVPKQGETNGPAPLSVLAPREREILGLLASGLRSQEIADRLAITAATVNVHRRNIKTKLGLRSIAELTRYAIRHGLTHSQ